MEEKKSVVIPVSNLVPGMIAAKDIYSRNDQLLISGGNVIDEAGIARITFFGILSVSVFVEDTETMEKLDGEMIEMPTEEEKFKKFQEKYDESILNVTHVFNQLLETDDEIEEDSLVNNVSEILKVTSNKYQVFDMLHYLKKFDDETYMHSVNVSLICNVFADWLGMSEYEKKLLTLCGLFHDYGKILINKDILRKPDRLTEREFEIIKEHPQKGYEFLKDVKIHESVKKAALQHHERCNGKGYPFGFFINEIDPYAAITSIADVYEAMTSTRVYRKALCPFDVIRLFEEEGRQQFNPNFLVPIMTKITDTYLQHEVVLSDGSKGKILLVNRDELSRPSILTDKGIVDLTKNRSIKITEVIK